MTWNRIPIAQALLLVGFALASSAQVPGSADLDNDGAVGPKDQFLFQEQWYDQDADAVAAFPDPNLERFVRSLIDQPTGDILVSRLDGITSLVIPTQLPVFDLAGVENFRRLQNLSAVTVRETTEGVDVGAIAGSAGLRTLRLQRISGVANPQVDVTPIVGLTQLYSLSMLGDQLINTEALAALEELVDLDLASCGLADIAFVAPMSRLLSLRVSGNAIVDISPLAGKTELITLDLSNNSIADLSPLAGLPNLSWINLGCNQITDLQPLVDNPGVGAGDVLILSGNDLDPVVSPPQLQALAARGVEIINPGRVICLSITKDAQDQP